MIMLQDTIDIRTSPEQVFTWLDHLPEHYLAWHPDHVACRFVKGDAFKEGSILYAEEYIHGKLHRLRFRATCIIPNSRLEYSLFPGMKGAMIIQPLNGMVRFTATLTFGTRVPMLGWLLDRALEPLLSRRLEAMRRHMQEEGENLKRLLEETAS
jgi:hypothetical protein